MREVLKLHLGSGSDGSEPSFRRTKITTPMVFNVKLGALTRKTRLCADEHKAPILPKESIYSSVPCINPVRTYFLLAALNGLKVLSTDIQNAYLTAPLTEKYYTITR